LESPEGGGVVVIGSAGALGGAVLRSLVADQPQPLGWITYHQNPEPAKDLAISIPGVRVAQCDLCTRSDIAALASEVEATAGYVRVLVHAAVDIRFGTVLELGYDNVSAVVESSGLSLLTVVEEFEHLLRPGSVVLFMTSLGSQRVIPFYGAVGAAKAVGEALIRYLAAELAPREIRVNAMSLGPFASEAARRAVSDVEALMKATDEATPRGRRLDVAEMGRVAAFLASPAASGVTGQVVMVDGGIFNRWVL
jgi:enoyl-[acyl-carrier protein] reductase III